VAKPHELTGEEFFNSEIKEYDNVHRL